MQTGKHLAPAVALAVLCAVLALAQLAVARESTSWPRTTCGAPAPVFATSRVVT
jgi:hypothetical protein